MCALTVSACWSEVMTVGKIFGLLIVISLAASGATLARDNSKHLGASAKQATASKHIAGGKGAKQPAKATAAATVPHVVPETPIVVGRSVGVHCKSKLHHVKVKAFESNENSASADDTK
jgi:hypothetical protein